MMVVFFASQHDAIVTIISAMAKIARQISKAGRTQEAEELWKLATAELAPTSKPVPAGRRPR